jgi:hydrogenase maturation factor
LDIDEEAIPILPETRALCAPLRLITSGTLLMAVAPGDAAAVVAALGGRDIGLRSKAGGERPLPHFERDEIAWLFE